MTPIEPVAFAPSYSGREPAELVGLLADRDAALSAAHRELDLLRRVARLAEGLARECGFVGSRAMARSGVLASIVRRADALAGPLRDWRAAERAGLVPVPKAASSPASTAPAPVPIPSAGGGPGWHGSEARRLMAERDAAKAECERLREALGKVIREFDELLAEQMEAE